MFNDTMDFLQYLLSSGIPWCWPQNLTFAFTVLFQLLNLITVCGKNIWSHVVYFLPIIYGNKKKSLHQTAEPDRKSQERQKIFFTFFKTFPAAG